jgi:hypothetical protein
MQSYPAYGAQPGGAPYSTFASSSSSSSAPPQTSWGMMPQPQPSYYGAAASSSPPAAPAPAPTSWGMTAMPQQPQPSYYGAAASSSPPAAAPAPAPSSSLPSFSSLPPAPGAFGLLVSGRPVILDFRSAGPQKFLAEVPEPGSAADVSMFLLPGISLPADKGVVVYAAPPPFSEWRVLGTLTPARPSGVFRTGWPSTPDIAAAPVVRIGVSVESIDTVNGITDATSGGDADLRLGFAQLVAQDLSQYLSSFAQVLPAHGERLVVPPAALSTWLRRFEDKFRRDPNFLYHKRA